MDLKHTTPALLVVAGSLVALGGCSAVTSSINTASQAADTLVNISSKASRATTNASVTEPDTPRYAQAVAFVRSERPQLRREAAVGGGEHVIALARLLDEPDHTTLGPWLQAHYAQVFGGHANARTVVGRIAARRG